jgi:hypothetical protein
MCDNLPFSETLDDNLRATYALALCKLYIEYLWTIVPRTCLSPDMRVPAGQEPGLIGKVIHTPFSNH